MNDEHVGHFRQQRDWREVFVHIVRLVIQHVRVDGQRTHVGEDDGVAIGCRLGDILHRHHAGTTGFILHKNTDAELLGQLHRHRTRHNFRGAARRKRDDKADRLGRPSGLGECSWRNDASRGNGCCRSGRL